MIDDIKKHNYFAQNGNYFDKEGKPFFEIELCGYYGGFKALPVFHGDNKNFFNR